MRTLRAALTVPIVSSSGTGHPPPTPNPPFPLLHPSPPLIHAHAHDQSSLCAEAEGGSSEAGLHALLLIIIGCSADTDFLGLITIYVPERCVALV